MIIERDHQFLLFFAMLGFNFTGVKAANHCPRIYFSEKKREDNMNLQLAHKHQNYGHLHL